MSEPLTLYRLMILYMLDKVDFPLTNTQITNFILEKDYTTYFTVQQTFSELVDSGLITAEPPHQQYPFTGLLRKDSRPLNSSATKYQTPSKRISCTFLKTIR